MKTFLRILTPFLFIALSLAGCFLSARLSHGLLEKSSTKFVQPGETVRSSTMVFINNGADVVMMPSSCMVGTGCFEESTKQWSNYSFLVPKDKEDFFRNKLSAEKGPPWYHFTVEQISEDRQLITLTSEGSHSFIKVYFEAADKEIRAVKYLDSNAIINKELLVMIFGVLLGCLAAFLIYRRFIRPKLASQNEKLSEQR